MRKRIPFTLTNLGINFVTALAISNMEPPLITNQEACDCFLLLIIYAIVLFANKGFRKYFTGHKDGLIQNIIIIISLIILSIVAISFGHYYSALILFLFDFLAEFCVQIFIPDCDQY